LLTSYYRKVPVAKISYLIEEGDRHIPPFSRDLKFQLIGPIPIAPIRKRKFQRDSCSDTKEKMCHLHHIPAVFIITQDKSF
jgi:hypothetical protein